MTSAEAQELRAAFTEAFLKLMTRMGHECVRARPDGRSWVGIRRMIYTHAIILGEIGDPLTYRDRWCYRSLEAAQAALEAWGDQPEPAGWHRHPDSGRRYDEEGNIYHAW